MANHDALYKNLGLRVGLEVHRQLATQHKLFCHCPVLAYSPLYHTEILRHMRPTLSELGEYDPAALMEFKTRKDIVYRLNRDTVCTYEMDEAPPFGLNPSALRHALVLADMLHVARVDEIHVARKQYLDGSIPTGFQRTMVIGVNGFILVEGRRLGVTQVSLEEDACREVSDTGHTRVLMTDRLSIPLIEMVTESDLHTPAEAAAAASVLRRLCHLSGVVRTGHGTARQDVNVSIAGGARVEIKGVSSIRQIPGLVHAEALRQKALLELRDELRRRGVGSDAFDTVECLQTGVQEVAALRLAGCAGLLGQATGTSRVFASELVDRARVIACLDSGAGVRHSDGMADMATLRLVATARDRLHAGPDDAVVLLSGPSQDVAVAVTEVQTRMREAIAGVPEETRRPLPNGETAFERLLASPDRMYPDTDLPPIAITDADVAQAAVLLPEPLEAIEARYRACGLSEFQIDRIITQDRFVLFDAALARVRIRASVLAYLLVDQRVRLEREGVATEPLTVDLLSALFGAEESAALSQKDACARLEAALRGGAV